MTDHVHHPGCGCAGAPAAVNPVAVELVRGNAVESRHRARACVVAADGRILHAWGDVDEPVFPRSAIKAVQAIPLVETGAFDAFGLGDRELALACSSHAAEPVHTDVAKAWIARIGRTVDAYECGTHLPTDEPTAHDLLRRGEAPSAFHNNCSGKHAGMITTAVHLGEDPRGYVRRDHPVQRRVEAVLADLSGLDTSALPVGIDGCSVPNWAMPLRAFAATMARFADPAGLPPARAAAMRRIAAAWAAHPRLISGTGRFDTRLMDLLPGEVLAKGGAEGVHLAILPRRGIAVAVKADDGNGRAAHVAAAAILRWLGVGGDAWAGEEGRALSAPAEINRAGIVTGGVRSAPGFPD
jgi:L-asparaginase II